MRRIFEGCAFTMGSPMDEEGRDPDEQQHSVTVSQAFWIWSHRGSSRSLDGSTTT